MASYKVIKKLPRDENFALSSQMRRACVSIPSNIAEGQKRRTTKDFIHFLSVARGSNAELQTQLLICNRLDYLSEADIQFPLQLSLEVEKMLSSLINSLKKQSTMNFSL